MTATTDSTRQPSLHASDRLLSRIQSAWQDIQDCTEAISTASAELRPNPDETASLNTMRGWYEQTTERLLVVPVRKFLGSQPLRRILEAMSICDQESLEAAGLRYRIDVRFQRVLILAALDLCEPWRIWRGGNHPAEWTAWRRRRAKNSKQASVLLDRYSRWALRAKSSRRRKDSRQASSQASSRTEGWWRLHGAVIATLEAELALRDLTLAWFQAFEAFAEDAQRESEELRSRTAQTLAWLRTGGDAPESLGLVTPEERLRGWALPIEIQAGDRLAERVEMAVGGRKPKLRTVELRASFLKTFDRYARLPMRTIVERSWQQRASNLRQIEQAKEMIAYWTEASSNRPEDAASLVAEARHNAIAALTQQLEIPVDAGELDAEGVKAFRTWHEKGTFVLEGEQYGWITLLLRPRARSLVGMAIETIQWKSRAVLQQTGRWVSSRVDRLMESLGGRIPPQPSLPPVVRRTTLRDTLALSSTKSNLPALYHLLFRLAPIEDRRFLVGRELELAGLRQALEDWTTGRFAACLLVGARGSGKTSLLNCAEREIFAGHKIVRAEFSERIQNPEDLDIFLRRLLSLSVDADIEAAFRSELRVVILEESERIYLRKVGGFATARYLVHLIHRTAATTLWIIVMNDRSFRVLDASTNLQRVFSHRINAMNVSRSDLESAILERHRLSGLRLDFARPPAGDPRVNRVRRWFGLEETAQKLFFDSLYQHSAGIFRSAFQLWLGSIESVEGETLNIRQPLDAAFARFRNELAQEDQFTLLAIQEHGSLTRDELSEVLREKPDNAGSRMDRLFALGLIENDPDHPGYRVSPEAQRFVNDLLRRTNFT